jgi:hypothetical protein
VPSDNPLTTVKPVPAQTGQPTGHAADVDYFLPNGTKAQGQVVGNKLILRGTDGKLAPAMDGAYRIADGKTIVIQGGRGIISMNRAQGGTTLNPQPQPLPAERLKLPPRPQPQQPKPPHGGESDPGSSPKGPTTGPAN